MAETRVLVLQMEYNGRSQGGPDYWQWLDSGVMLRGEGRKEQLADARIYARSRPPSKAFRRWRVVERVLVSTETVIEEIDLG